MCACGGRRRLIALVCGWSAVTWRCLKNLRHHRLAIDQIDGRSYDTSGFNVYGASRRCSEQGLPTPHCRPPAPSAPLCTEVRKGSSSACTSSGASSCGQWPTPATAGSGMRREIGH